MEEQVGIAWHKLINRLATRRYPDESVALSDISTPVGILFRALGGDHGVAIQAGGSILNHAKRSLLERLAGSERKVELAWVDHQALQLPAVIDSFPTQRLNNELYLWLAALSATSLPPQQTWLARNQNATRLIIQRFPGMAAIYRRLVAAEILRRGPTSRLPPDEAQQEQAIRDALHEPGSISVLPHARRAHQPILLWLRPDILTSASLPPQKNQDQASRESSTTQSDKKRRMAEYTEMPERKGGLLLFRPESIFSWSEYAKIEHEAQENEDEDLAQAADDLDTISITRDSRNIAKKLSMSLDLPKAASALPPLNDGKMLPEWDYKTRTLKPDQCRVNTIPLTDVEPCALPEHLKRDQQRLKRQFGALQPVRQRLKGQPDGNDIDIDAYIRHISHQNETENRFYIDHRNRERDLSCLLLADLSLSTEAWVGDNQRVIDVIRESLFLFAETLTTTLDQFALYGFSSKQRTDVRVHTLKAFDEPYSDIVRGRINGISSAYYTRMGAAIRHATEILARQKTRERLLLLLTDGKPNDADHYEGRYGIEDTRKALIEARQQGLRPFCVTVDQEAHEYLPHIFGKSNFIIIRKPSELPARLPLLYALITR
ncbi:nitric oxide reductase activation protein NorD [Halothiobacillus sp.]|uniref:nitric oxide reductase activation protein NorD n=1 Tax=Halothiobacillus sp. TaxID=1891311 RepID=UPI002AD2D5E4|nr:VWA domain-containing protein [Halothiobacillus sp.]